MFIFLNADGKGGNLFRHKQLGEVSYMYYFPWMYIIPYLVGALTTVNHIGFYQH